MGEYDKPLGTLTLIDEPTYIEDINGLLAEYAKRLIPLKWRFECDYEQCKRILFSEAKEPFTCTACGHGTMQLQIPKNYCCECHAPIYSNVNSDCDVVCEKCVEIKIALIEHIENLGGKALKEFREMKSWSQEILGAYLNISQQYIADVENGRKPLNKKMLRLLVETWLEFDHTNTLEPQKGCEKVIENKQVSARKKGGLSKQINMSHQFQDRCHKCGQYKDEWEVTAELIKGWWLPVCEDCLENPH